MEHEDNVVSHALLSDQHLLLSVDNEVPALIVLAFTGFLDDGVVVHRAQVAEVGADHDWNLANGDLVILQKSGDLFHTVDVCNLLDRHFAEHLSLVCQSSDSGLMGLDGSVDVLFLLLWILIDSCVAENDLVLCLVVISHSWQILLVLLDCRFTELVDNLLDLVLQETLE